MIRSTRFPLLFVYSMLAVLVLSCADQPKAAPKKYPGAEMLVGTWQSEELTVRLHSAYGIADSFAEVQAKRNNWVAVMGLLPIETTFNMDYTYSAVYREPDGSIRSETSGYFEMFGQDSLLIHRLVPSKETIRHSWVQKNDSVYGFSSLVDYDRDGQVDDELFAINKRIRR
ncbi:MAG: hypothetical protein GC205_10475 [Bacteroidetes bacterium]|nr:hypothetical protein [Bacteroidota bacterium]